MSYPDPNQPQQPGHQPPAPHGPPAPPPPFAAPPPATKKTPTKLILAIVGGFLVLCCGGVAIAAAMGAGDEPAAVNTDPAPPAPAATKAAPGTKTAAPAPAKAAPEGPGLGDPVRDGKFEFTVAGVKCGAAKVGNQFANETAQGMFCLVDVTVKNIGQEAQTFSGASQKAFDATGTQFSNDTGAEIYANEGASTFLEEINPGNQVKGKLVFDVPKGTKLTALELHDSMFSGGVRLNLS